MTLIARNETKSAVVSILIVVFNKLEYTRRCLDTLYQNTNDEYPFEVVVVDNGSSDGTADYLNQLRFQHPNLRVVTNSENLGFVGGNNVGAEYANGRYICFLNNDTEVISNWLTPVVTLLENQPDVGAVGSKLIYPDGRLQEAGGIIFRNGTGCNYGRYDHPGNPEYNFVREVDYCSGAALTVRTDLFRSLGGFDSRYAPAYYEDTDLCFSIRSLGYKVMYHHESEVIHHEGVTGGTDTGSGFKRYQMINQPRFVDKWAELLEEQPEAATDKRYIRSICDRRTRRSGRQVLAGAVEIQQHDRQGGAFRFVNFMKLLVKAGHHVTFFAQNTRWRKPDVDLEPYVHELRRMGVLVYRFDTGYNGEKIVPDIEQLDTLIEERRYDAALLCSGFDSQPFVHRIALNSPRTRIVVDSLDLAYLREGRKLEQQHIPSRWWDYQDRKHRELSAYKHADAVLVVTEKEREMLNRELGQNKSFYVPDIYPVPELVPDYETRSGVVFLAGFRHAPNLDAARLLLDQIMPRIWARMPEVQLTLLGDSPPDWLQERADARVVVTGYVPDLQPYLQSARVAVAPITWGAGMKGKICQAMVAGTPNVVTPSASEGMGLVDGKDVLIADSADLFSELVTQLYGNREVWRQLSDNGRCWVSERYSEQLARQRLTEVLFPQSTHGAHERQTYCYELASMGYNALREDRLDHGEQTFRELIEQYPDFAEGYLGLGRALMNKQRYREAAGAMRRALELTQNPLIVQISLAELLYHAGETRDSAKVLEKGIAEAGPEHEHCQVALGMLLNIRNHSDPSYPHWYTRRDMQPRRPNTGETRPGLSGPSDFVHLFVVHQTGDNASLADTLDSLANQLCDQWRLTVVSSEPAANPLFEQLEMLEWVTIGRDPAEAVFRLVGQSTAKWVGLIDAGSKLHAEAIRICFDEVTKHPEWRMVYTDEDSIAAHGVRFAPRFKPDFNLELLRSMPYIGGLCLVRKDAFNGCEEVGRLGSVWNCEMAFRIQERFGPNAIGHVADVLYHSPQDAGETLAPEAEHRQSVEAHLARSGQRARIGQGFLPNTNIIEYCHDENPLVSLIIPSRGDQGVLARCLDSVFENTAYRAFEIVVVLSEPCDAETGKYLKMLAERDSRVAVRYYSGPYDISAMSNYGASAAQGEYLLLLSEDALAIQRGWLDRLVGHGQRDEVGAVGCRVVDSEQRLVGAGIVLGSGEDGVGDNMFFGLSLTDPGYLGRAQVAQEVSAVTAEALLIRKSLFQEVGGFDGQNLSGRFRDIDLCLRIGALGYQVIWTPHVTFLQMEDGGSEGGRSKGGGESPEQATEPGVMIERWLPRLAADPAYNRNLSLSEPYVVVDGEVGAHWDLNREEPRVMALLGGSGGESSLRVERPLELLSSEGYASTHIIRSGSGQARVPSVVELAREAPDVLLAYRAFDERQIEALERYRRFSPDTFLVFRQDELALDRQGMSETDDSSIPDLEGRLRRAIKASHRLLVPTDGLADAYRHSAEEIAVVPDYLDGRCWRELRSKRRVGRRPRVGWTGTPQEAGDLELLLDVIKETSKEVQWVLLGPCFEEWLGFGVEVHNPIGSMEYPTALASLNLDLAVAPLISNRYNECRGNLKVLEYGALGIPVIGSNVGPLRTAPVARVRNTKDAWINGLRERLSDIDELAREGDRLQSWVWSGWLLENHLDEWLTACAVEGDSVLGTAFVDASGD